MFFLVIRVQALLWPERMVDGSGSGTREAAKAAKLRIKNCALMCLLVVFLA